MGDVKQQAEERNTHIRLKLIDKTYPSLNLELNRQRKSDEAQRRAVSHTPSTLYHVVCGYVWLGIIGHCSLHCRAYQTAISTR